MGNILSFEFINRKGKLKMMRVKRLRDLNVRLKNNKKKMKNYKKREKKL